MSRPTLVYFHLPGRAEVSRLLFTLGKTDFEVGMSRHNHHAITSTLAVAAPAWVYVRHAHGQQAVQREWLLFFCHTHGLQQCLMSNTQTPNQTTQDKRISFEDWKNKPELKAKKPFGQLPVLKVDGKVLAQSAAIGE